MYKTGNVQEKEKEEVVSYDPTRETVHRCVFLYKRMQGSDELFFIFQSETLSRRYQTRGRDGGRGWLKGETLLKGGWAFRLGTQTEFFAHRVPESPSVTTQWLRRLS